MSLRLGVVVLLVSGCSASPPAEQASCPVSTDGGTVIDATVFSASCNAASDCWGVVNGEQCSSCRCESVALNLTGLGCFDLVSQPIIAANCPRIVNNCLCTHSTIACQEGVCVYSR